MFGLMRPRCQCSLGASGNPLRDVRPGGAVGLDMRVARPRTPCIRLPGCFMKLPCRKRFLVTSRAFEDAAGHPQLEVLPTMLSAEQEGRTKLILKARLVRTAPGMARPPAGLGPGWGPSRDRLAAERDVKPRGAAEPSVARRRGGAPVGSAALPPLASYTWIVEVTTHVPKYQTAL